MRVILIVESPLSARDAERFGLDMLADSGLAPEVWEVGPIYLPRAELQWREPAVGFSVTRFENIGQFEAATANCTHSDTIISLVGTQRGQLRRYRELLRSISSTPATLGTISATPVVDVGFHAATGPIVRIRSFWSRTLRRQGVIRRASQTFVRRKYGIRPLDIAWVATTDALIEPLLMDRESRIVKIHSLDYDLVLQHRQQMMQNGSILLLDTMGPDHPDYVTHDENPWTMSSEAYFCLMRRLLDEIEASSGLSIAVAAHPRAEPGSLETRYGGRIVYYGRTAEAISRARIVLLTNTSTAVGLAVAMNKPMVMITDSGRSEADMRKNERLVSLLNLMEWTTKSASDFWVWPSVDFAGYGQYMSEWVKCNGTPDAPFWEVLIASLDYGA
jgi:hypothetical protein